MNQIAPRPIVLALMALFSGTLCGFAEDLYVGQSSAGGDTGVDAANRHSITWLNNAANWGAGADKVSPADTVRLVGTFTSPLVIAGSGTAGNVVTILFEDGANFTTGCWPAAGAIQIDNKEYLTIDGGVNGSIKNTSNGTGDSKVLGVIQNPNNGARLATQNSSRGIGGNGNGTATVSHSTIKNLTISHIYRKEKGVLDDTRLGYPIDVSGTELVIENNRVADGDGLIGFSIGSTGTANNIYIRNNVLRDYNHGIVIGVGDTNSAINNIHIYGNNLDHSDTWDCPGNTPIHLDAIIILNNGYSATSIIDGMKIYQNWFGPHVGTRTTAAIFNSLQGSQVQAKNWYIFNNLFQCKSGYSWGNGFIACGANTLRIFNNTFIGTIDGGGNWGGGVSFGGANAIFKNNILWSGAGLSVAVATSDNVPPADGTGVQTTSILNTYFSTIYSDYNIIVGAQPTFGFLIWKYQPSQTLWLSGSLNGFQAWRTWYDNNRGMAKPIWNSTHADPHSTTIAPTFTPGTFVPSASDTQARGKGVNLTHLFTEMGLPATDYNGKPRPASGPWTIGAFEVAGTTSARTPGVPFAATGGNLTAPFTTVGNAVSQPFSTGLADGGRASYSFTTEEPGDYAIRVLVDAPNDASNSVFLNVDAEPQGTLMIWDVLPLTTGVENRVVSWRGSGTFDNNESSPKYFTLAAGQHELIIRGMDGNVRLENITIVKRPERVARPRLTASGAP